MAKRKKKEQAKARKDLQRRAREQKAKAALAVASAELKLAEQKGAQRLTKLREFEQRKARQASSHSHSGGKSRSVSASVPIPKTGFRVVAQPGARRGALSQVNLNESPQRRRAADTAVPRRTVVVRSAMTAWAT